MAPATNRFPLLKDLFLLLATEPSYHEQPAVNDMSNKFYFVPAGLFNVCFHYPPDSDMDCWIF